MKDKKDKPWFSYDGAMYEGAQPFFYDTGKFPWVKVLEENWHIIRQELEEELASNKDDFLPYMNKEISSGKDRWKTLGLMFWTLSSVTNCQKFPKTWQLLKKIPNVCAASFNLLELNSTIKPHNGNTDAIIRCHMGLDIPAPAPKCGFRVGDETRSWKNGEILMFCDAHNHTAWNNTQQQRYVLVIDIFRPEFEHQSVGVSSKVMSQIYYDVARQKYSIINKLSKSKLFSKVLFGVYYCFFNLKIKSHIRT